MTQSGIAKRHGISRVTLWKLAKENDWHYASDREKALQKFNENSMLRMNDQRLSAVEDHAVQLTEIREKVNDIKTLEELSQIFKISRERVRQIEVKAFDKLRKKIRILQDK